MSAKKYVVKLSEEEREELKQLISRGKSSARKQTRARILLKADEGLKDREIVAAMERATAGRLLARLGDPCFDVSSGDGHFHTFVRLSCLAAARYQPLSEGAPFYLDPAGAKRGFRPAGASGNGKPEAWKEAFGRASAGR